MPSGNDISRKEPIVGEKLDRTKVGVPWPPQTTVVDVAATTAFAAATNDDNLRYTQASGAIAPPLYCVVPLGDSILAAMASGHWPIPQGALAPHGEHDIYFLSPIEPGDTLVTETQVIDISDHPTGEAVTIEAISRTTDGQERCRSLMTLLAIGDAARMTTPKNKPSAALEARATPAATATMLVEADQTWRYADASGDHNPPHIDVDLAKSMGLPNVLVHGLCTMAFAGKGVVDELADGDPSRLARLKVRFSRPVFPHDTLTTTMWTDDHKHVTFEMTNQRGTRAITHGVAKLR